MTAKTTLRVLVRQALALLLLSNVPWRVTSQECDANGVCDTHERCPIWREEGECFRSPDYMENYCPVSCRTLDTPDKDACQDALAKCSVWAELGECKKNEDMKRYCRKSCGVCNGEGGDDWVGEEQRKVEEMVDVEDSDCTDDHEQCSTWAQSGECEKNARYMLLHCAKSCGGCDKLATTPPDSINDADDAAALLEKTVKFGEKQTATGNKKSETLIVVRDMVKYMESSDEFMALPIKVQENCRNKHDLCSFWAAIGECSENMAYMKIQCAPACKSCHLIDMANRCPELPDAVPGLKPGDMNAMFERIVEFAPGNKTLSVEDRQQLADSNMTEFSVVVHSRPSDEPSTKFSLATDKELPPWVITLENFLTDEECDILIQHGHKEGYKRSEDVGKQNFDGTVGSVKSQGRTSENAWCSSRNGCREETVPNMIHQRIADLLRIPPANSEDFQILRYEVGQFYNTHHDYIPNQRKRQCGPRILTFFMYLSDVDVGGGTDFPDLGITVMPKKGRALLWPSVYNSDDRMRHQALPVEAGTKFAANGWIHLYDYQTPQSTGCN